MLNISITNHLRLHLATLKKRQVRSQLLGLQPLGTTHPRMLYSTFNMDQTSAGQRELVQASGTEDILRETMILNRIPNA